MKVAMYTRVSTDKQDYKNQLIQLRNFCQNQGWEIYKEYSETISGKESQRPKFKELLEDASKKKFDSILVWSLDRFTREGTSKVWQYFSLLQSYNIQFISFQEPYLRTDNELARDILISVMGALAKQERIRLSERTKAGLQRVKEQGTKLGRPSIEEEIIEKAKKLHKEGKSYSSISEDLNISKGSISNILVGSKKGIENLPLNLNKNYC